MAQLGGGGGGNHSGALDTFSNGREDYLTQFAFRVEIDGIVSGAFRKAGPFRWTTKVKPIREGGNNRGTVNLVEAGEFAPIKLEKGLVGANGEFFEWMKSLHDPGKSFKRANISVVLMHETGEEASRYNIFNALPSRYEMGQLDGKTNELAVESVEIHYDYFEFVEGKAPKVKKNTYE